MACVNAYRLHFLFAKEKEEKPLTHLQFRTELYCKLLGYSNQAQLQQLRTGLGGKRLFNPDLEHLHYRKPMARGSCIWCAYDLKCKRVVQKEITGTANRSTSGCTFCNVLLC
jgi:hypothetical protein